MKHFSFETSDGVSKSETGEVKNAGTDEEFIAVRGTISWTDNDGQVFTLNYVADDTGFHPEGAHLPVAPDATPIASSSFKAQKPKFGR